jgi:Protein of unknown function (DUF2934)
MSLLFYAKPFLELGICKEYCMARKTDGTTTSRKKKTTSPAEPVAVQASAEQVTPEVQSAEVRSPEVRNEVRNEVRRNVTPINVAPAKPTAKKARAGGSLDNANLDEEIRRRAYELFLERKGAAGDPNADWLIAEREVRARLAGKEAALAATQGRS